MDKSQFNKTCLILNEINLDQQELKEQFKVKIAIEKMVYWKKRYEYLKLFKYFLENKINNIRFSTIILNCYENMIRESKEIRLKLVEKAKNNEDLDFEFFEISKFFQNEHYDKTVSLLDELFTACECVTFDLETYQQNEDYYLNENEFEIKVKSIISKLKLYFQV